MAKILLYLLVLFFAFSCNKEVESNIKQQYGKVWLSGGLLYCAEQIHLDCGDTLIASNGLLIPFKSGDRVNVKYRETGFNKNCISYIDCEIVEISRKE